MVVSIKLNVLIVEDDFMIADMAEEFLVEHGFDVCGTAGTVEEAIALGQLHRPDLALLDCRLAEGGLGTEVATRLLALGDVGILYATGNSTTGALKDADGDASISKPYRAEDLVRALEIVADIKANGLTARPFPHGFRLLKSASLRQAEFFHG
jgi:DNA-binding response OmpR family regulator